jgi:hypothetical protein
MKLNKIAKLSLIPTGITYVLFNLIWWFIDPHNKGLFILTCIVPLSVFAFTFYYQINYWSKKGKIEI